MAKKHLNLDTILQMATKLADEHGLEQVTLASLAQQLGIKTPSLYNHMEGMAGLRKELALHGVRKLKETLMEAAIGKSGAAAIFAIGEAYVAFVRRHPGLYEATMPAFTPMDEELQNASMEVVDLLLRVLEEYELGEEEAIHIVRGLRSLVHGFASLELRNGFGIPLDRDESLRWMLQTYVAGIQNNG